jgi:hypothetical protein
LSSSEPQKVAEKITQKYQSDHRSTNNIRGKGEEEEHEASQITFPHGFFTAQLKVQG